MPVSVKDLKQFNPEIAPEKVAEFENGIRDAKTYFARFAENLSTPPEPDAEIRDGAFYGRLNFAYGLPANTYNGISEACKNFKWSNIYKQIEDMGEHKIAAVQGNDVFEGSVDVHFVHRKAESNRGDRKVILLVHGWPGSFFEFKKVAKPLSEAGFDLVIPSLPGYVYSEKPPVFHGRKDESVWTQTKTAACLDGVMQKLGYSEYYAQGGDWGSLVVRRVAQLFPQRCRAIHINFLMMSNKYLPKPDQVASLSPQEQKDMKKLQYYIDRGSAYSIMQGTTPYTLGSALAAHPMSAVVYLSEIILRACGNYSYISLEDMIGFIALYYLTNKITSSFWLYYNLHLPNGDHRETVNTKVQVPVGVRCGDGEIFMPPIKAAENVVNVKSWGIFENTGHFVAMEDPQEFVNEMIQFFFQNPSVKL